MLTSEDYRQLAERCVLLAKQCAKPDVAEALTTLALDYLTRAMGCPSDRSQLQSGAHAAVGRGMVR